jgi:hypothetical protein
MYARLQKQLQGSLTRLSAARTGLVGLRAAVELRELVATAEVEFIDQARSAGESWSAIGAALGMSAQGAQQRSHRR